MSLMRVGKVQHFHWNKLRESTLCEIVKFDRFPSTNISFGSHKFHRIQFEDL